MLCFKPLVPKPDEKRPELRQRPRHPQLPAKTSDRWSVVLPELWEVLKEPPIILEKMFCFDDIILWDSQCGNCEILLRKNCVKSTFLQENSTLNWFDEKIARQWISHFLLCTVLTVSSHSVEIKEFFCHHLGFTWNKSWHMSQNLPFWLQLQWIKIRSLWSCKMAFLKLYIHLDPFYGGFSLAEKFLNFRNECHQL